MHIPTASTLSASCVTAKTLAEEFNGKVHVVDNYRISSALRFSVYDAKSLREKGFSAKEIAEKLEEMKFDCSTYFSLESMEYLKRGGRISATAATIGSILKLRPVLYINEGKLVKFALPKSLNKAKQVMLNAVKKDLNEKFKKYLDKGEIELRVVYGDNKEDAVAFAEEVRTVFPNVPVLPCDPVSLSVACHTGPKTLVLSCARVVK